MQGDDRLCPTICTSQRPCRHATPNVIQSCVLPRAMIACHPIRHPTIYAAQDNCGHSTLDIVQRFGHSKGDNGMPSPTSSGYVFCPRKMTTCHTLCHSTLCVLFKGDDVIPRATSFVCIFSPRAMISCYGQCRLTMSFSLWRYWHGTPHIV